MKQIKFGEHKPSFQKIPWLIKLGIGIIVVIFILEIWAVNRLSTSGYKIQEIKVSQAELSLENQLLKNEIAQLISLNFLASKVKEYGFIPSHDIEYLQRRE